MYRRITWTASVTTRYTATVWVPDEWLGEGEAVDHLDDLVAPAEHEGHAEADGVSRTFVESHPRQERGGRAGRPVVTPGVHGLGVRAHPAADRPTTHGRRDCARSTPQRERGRAPPVLSSSRGGWCRSPAAQDGIDGAGLALCPATTAGPRRVTHPRHRDTTVRTGRHATPGAGRTNWHMTVVGAAHRTGAEVLQCATFGRWLSVGCGAVWPVVGGTPAGLLGLGVGGGRPEVSTTRGASVARGRPIRRR